MKKKRVKDRREAEFLRIVSLTSERANKTFLSGLCCMQCITVLPVHVYH